jgi:hypothetical protein
MIEINHYVLSKNFKSYTFYELSMYNFLNHDLILYFEDFLDDNFFDIVLNEVIYVQEKY